jgi:hypothetical protein
VWLYFFCTKVFKVHLEDERHAREAREVGIGTEKIADAIQAYPTIVKTPLCRLFAFKIWRKQTTKRKGFYPEGSSVFFAAAHRTSSIKGGCSSVRRCL